MSITLSDGSIDIVLGDQFKWSDEFSYTPVSHTVSYTLSGAAVVQVSKRKSGQPITLEGAEDRAWQTGDKVSKILEWSRIPGQRLALSLRGKNINVIFRHDDPPAFSADPIFDISDPQDDDYFAVTLKFMVI